MISDPLVDRRAIRAVAEEFIIFINTRITELLVNVPVRFKSSVSSKPRESVWFATLLDVHQPMFVGFVLSLTTVQFVLGE